MTLKFVIIIQTSSCRSIILFLKTFFRFWLIRRHLLFRETIMISSKQGWGTSLASMQSIISELLCFRIYFGDLLFSIILNFFCWLSRILLLHLSLYLKCSFFRKRSNCCWYCVREILHIYLSNYNYNQKKLIW